MARYYRLWGNKGQNWHATVDQDIRDAIALVDGQYGVYGGCRRGRHQPGGTALILRWR